jgi:hypothetical protein
MSAADRTWAVCVACLCAITVLLGVHLYELLHRSDCLVSRRPAQVLSVSALGASAAITASVLNLTTG